MSVLEALILGIIQGLTEFLPVSSSGHLELGKALLGIEASEDVTFTVVVHGATVLSTIVVFRKEILELITSLFQFRWNESTQYVSKILLSMIPVVIIGLFFKDEVEALFNNSVPLVGSMLLVTGALLAFTHYAPQTTKGITFKNAFIIGLAQAVAVLPGISRSGSTIATALLLGVDRQKAAKFSFLMVLAPILGANAKEIMDGGMAASSIEALPLIIGFIAAFVSGVLACTWMIKLVTKGRLIYFAYYCFAVGIVSISLHFYLK